MDFLPNLTALCSPECTRQGNLADDPLSVRAARAAHDGAADLGGRPARAREPRRHRPRVPDAPLVQQPHRRKDRPARDGPAAGARGRGPVGPEPSDPRGNPLDMWGVNGPNGCERPLLSHRGSVPSPHALAYCFLTCPRISPPGFFFVCTFT